MRIYQPQLLKQPLIVSGSSSTEVPAGSKPIESTCARRRRSDGPCIAPTSCAARDRGLSTHRSSRPSATRSDRYDIVETRALKRPSGLTHAQELSQVTNQHVVADLRAADMRAGHWLDEDPSLEMILNWIRAHP